MPSQVIEQTPKKLLAAKLFALLTRVVRDPRSWSTAVWKIRNRLLPRVPLPTRLPWGDRWLAWNDILGRHVWLDESFERAESNFFRRFITPGMVVIECGAHQGYFTLLFARQVGPDGQVVAIEPSPRERARLSRHLQLNRCRNVIVHPIALGSRPGVETLHLCSRETGCSSLRPPAVLETTVAIQVQVATLDTLLSAQQRQCVDFVKLDAEGAELSILEGAEAILRCAQPIICCELADVRTKAWGYQAIAIYRFLEERGYRWYAIEEDGSLTACPARTEFHVNLIAIPVSKSACMEQYFK